MPHDDRISRRRFKSPYWDVPPVGFEHITVTKYKALQASGQVPQTVVNPSSHHLQQQQQQQKQQQQQQHQQQQNPRTRSDPMIAVRAAAAQINAQLAGNLTRQARRLYIGNIPIGCTNEDMIEFFQSKMNSPQPGNPVLACQINLDKNFAFLEFRTVEETTLAMALDGVLCRGQALKIRRPHDYQPIPGSEATSFAAEHAPPHIPGVVSTVVADSPNKIYIGGLPTNFTDDSIKEILIAFGELKAFNLIRDPATLASKGYAFCEYLDSTNTERAIMGLNGFEIGDKKLVVQRASLGSKSGGPPMGAAHINSTTTNTTTSSFSTAALLQPVEIQVPGLQNITSSSTHRVLTEVLCLMNMLDPNELKDDDEYRDILEDIREECDRYGRVRSLEIPRPGRGDDAEPTPGLGKVFVEFDSATDAQRAQLKLAGRRFSNRVVVVSYFDRERYRNKDF